MYLSDDLHFKTRLALLTASCNIPQNVPYQYNKKNVYLLLIKFTESSRVCF